MRTDWANAVTWSIYTLFGLALGSLAVIDLREHRLPNRIVVPLAAVGLVGLSAASLLQQRPARMLGAVGCMAVLLAVFFAITLVGPMGYGDVKLAAVLGLYLGWLGGVRTVYLAFVVGSLAAALFGVAVIAACRVRGRAWRGRSLPYGPFLVFGTLVALAAWGWSR